ncbi:MAG: DUF6458 family protein [Solirubrobacteraceae bacterium]
MTPVDHRQAASSTTRVPSACVFRRRRSTRFRADGYEIDPDRVDAAQGIGTSIFLIAVGAILKFAVTASVSGIEPATVGVILMIVGGIGLLWSAVPRRAGTRSHRGDRRTDPYV